MATFSQIKSGLDEIAAKNERNRTIIESSRSSLGVAQTNLSKMLTDYSQLVADINQTAIDNPTDDAYRLAKSEKDKLVADFQALKTYVDSLIVAYDAVNE